MKSLARSVTGFGGTALMLASLVATGCGTHVLPGTVIANTRTLAARSVQNPLMHSRPLVRPLTDKTAIARIQALGRKLAIHGVDMPPRGTVHAQAAGDAPADAPADGPAPAALPAAGDAPAPGPTPTAAPAKAAAPAAKDDVDALFTLMTGFGYDGDKDEMIDAIHDVTYQYPTDVRDPASPYFAPKGWDKTEYDRLATHFCYWLPNFDVPVKNPDDYATQALTIAQSRTDVVYYIWVSKPTSDFWPNQTVVTDGSCPAPMPVTATPNPNSFANVSGYAPIYVKGQGFNIVKAVKRFGWMVNISAVNITPDEKIGKIEDYFEIPAKFQNPVDWGNIVPIPTSLYF